MESCKVRKQRVFGIFFYDVDESRVSKEADQLPSPITADSQR